MTSIMKADPFGDKNLAIIIYDDWGENVFIRITINQYKLLRDAIDEYIDARKDPQHG